jgi:hypothetical protein
MKLIVTEANDIEIVYQFVVKELEQMPVTDAERKKLLLVRKNNFICNNNRIYLKFLYGTNSEKIND